MLYIDWLSQSIQTDNHSPIIMATVKTLASHADVLRGSPRVPVPITTVSGTGMRDEPLRTSAWEAIKTRVGISLNAG